MGGAVVGGVAWEGVSGLLRWGSLVDERRYWSFLSLSPCRVLVLTVEPHDILLILLVVNHLWPLDNLAVRDVGPRLRREDMAHSLPRDKVAAAVAVDADEATIPSSVHWLAIIVK